MSSVEHAGEERESDRPHRLRHQVGIGFLAVLIAIGAYFALTAFGFGIAAEGTPIGPGAVPAGLGIVLIVGSGVLLVAEVRALRATPREEGAPRLGKEARDLLRAFLVIALLGVGLAVTPVIGMVLALTLSVALIAAIVERLSPLKVLIVSAVAFAILWVVFGVILDVNFPRSMIGVEQWM